MRNFIPGIILQDLRCGHCRKFVNCGPVYVLPDSGILCGRCQNFAKPIYRNVAFEAIAAIYMYPCNYWPKHCNRQLAWNEALEHERSCLYKSGCNIFCSKPGTFFKSERKFRPNGEITPEQVSDETLKYLRCAHCQGYLSNSPVYILADNKNICHRCSHANGVPKGALQNLAFEKIAHCILFPCVYRNRGCARRARFGRELWGHEGECPYGQTTQTTPVPQLEKKVSKVGKDGKQKGVIVTHSGHIYATITPHSAPFAPPTNKNQDNKMVTQELVEMMKKKKEDQKFDSQSVDSMVSKSTADSLGDNLRDNVSRSTVDNISRDNVSRSTVDNISRSTIDNLSRSSSRVMARSSVDTNLNEDFRSIASFHSDLTNKQLKIPRPPSFEANNQYPTSPTGEVVPLPTPVGFQKISNNGYYQENVFHFDPNSHLYHYPPVYQQQPSLQHSGSFNQPFMPPNRSGSFMNPQLMSELRERQTQRQIPAVHNPYEQCNNLQDLVQKHNEVSQEFR